MSHDKPVSYGLLSKEEKNLNEFPEIRWHDGNFLQQTSASYFQNKPPIKRLDGYKRNDVLLSDFGGKVLVQFTISLKNYTTVLIKCDT